MTGRIILTILVLIVGYFGHSIVEQYLIPQNSQDLAIQQIKEDGSRELMRIQELAQNWLDPIYYIVFIGIIFGIWYQVIKKGEYFNKKVEVKTEDKK